VCMLFHTWCFRYLCYFQLKCKTYGHLFHHLFHGHTLLLVVLITYKLGLNVSHTNKKACFLNINAFEVIQYLFLQKEQ
jgi:hypothetical protein